MRANQVASESDFGPSAARVFLRQAAVYSGLAVATVSGCSGAWAGDSELPDYDPLRADLSVAVAIFAGWSGADDSDAEYRRHVERRLRGRMLASRTFRSEATGTEVRLTVVAGPRKRLRLFSPLGFCCTSAVRDIKKIELTDQDASFEFQSCRRFERVHGTEDRHLWMHTFNGEWTADFLQPSGVFLPGNPHEVCVSFSTPVSSSEESGELSNEARRLVAEAIGRISPILLADGLGFGEPADSGD